jgi:hypothetical protein
VRPETTVIYGYVSCYLFSAPFDSGLPRYPILETTSCLSHFEIDAVSTAIRAEEYLFRSYVTAGCPLKGRRASIGNLALRLKYTLEQKQDKPTTGDVYLTKRIMELQLREIREQMAELDYELAIARQNFPDDIPIWEDKRAACLSRLNTAEQTLQEFVQAQSPSSTTSALGDILDHVANSMTQEGRNAAPYRGAMGYALMLDTEEDIETGFLPFTSPFGLVKDILEDQCKAQPGHWSTFRKYESLRMHTCCRRSHRRQRQLR